MLTLAISLCLFCTGSAIAGDKLLLPLPDINQLDAGDNGEIACGPAAAANYIFWLASNGRSSLAAPEFGPEPVLSELKRMMGTQGRGTSAMQFSTGLESFFRAKGLPVSQLDCAGWRSGCTGSSPELGNLKAILKRGGGVFLNFGWYRSSGAISEYKRTGGHWVCLVGYGVDCNGRDDPSVLVVHDPSPRCGSMPNNEFLQMKKFDDANLLVSDNKPAVDGSGYYFVDSGWRMPARTDVAILDAAICVVPQCP